MKIFILFQIRKLRHGAAGVHTSVKNFSPVLTVLVQIYIVLVRFTRFLVQVAMVVPGSVQFCHGTGQDLSGLVWVQWKKPAKNCARSGRFSNGPVHHGFQRAEILQHKQNKIQKISEMGLHIPSRINFCFVCCWTGYFISFLVFNLFYLI